MEIVLLSLPSNLFYRQSLRSGLRNITVIDIIYIYIIYIYILIYVYNIYVYKIYSKYK